MKKLATKYPFISKCQVWQLNGVKKNYRLGNRTQRLLYILKKPFKKIYFKIEYGKAKNSKGHWEMFYNDYVGTDPKEALQTFRAFME
jgi:hypothetical protein